MISTQAVREIALKIESLSKTFGANTVLRDVRLDLMPGEIHGLLGENGSGKSTLIKLLSGYHEPDPGASVLIWGRPVVFPLRPGASRALGLSFVHQDLGLIPEISIAENLFMSEIAVGRRRLTRRQMAQATRRTLDQYAIEARPKQPVSSLRLGDRAMVAIARAIREVSGDETAGGRVLILDEPTASMSLDEKRDLYRTFASLSAAGHALMLVSHDLDEIMEVTDVVTVLRDGKVAGTVRTGSATPSEIVGMILGRSVGEAAARPARLAGPARLEAADVSSSELSGVSFVVRSGEIIGFAGLVGSGYAGINQTLFGLKEGASGELRVEGQQVDLRRHKPAASVRLEMGLVPAERDKTGVSLDLSVADNLSVQLLRPVKSERRLLWLSRSRLRRSARAAVDRYRIKTPALGALLKTLSGGNRQKVMLAKWLAAGKSILLLDEPTQAVDIGAHEEILNVLDRFAREGGSVLIASADWEQLAAICDRVLIFADGAVKDELVSPLSKQAIGEACYKWGTRSTRVGGQQS